MMSATASSDTTRRHIIPVPAALLKQDLGKTTLMIAKHFITFAVPLILATYAISIKIPPALLGAATILLTLLSSFGLHSLGVMGHEGTHFTLHKKRIISAYIGVLVSALVPFHLDMGFAIRHNQHHRFTNTDKDPDLKVFSSFRSLWSRLFLARLRASHEYMSTTLQLASGRYPAEWDAMLNLSRSQITNLARTNITASILFTLVYVLIAINSQAFAIAFLATFTWAILISGLRPFLEHAGTNSDRMTNSRSWISPLFNVLYAGINYHLAHHLAPGVPAYRIKEFHQWLLANNYIQQAQTIQIQTLGEAIAVLRNQPYGSSRLE